MRSADHATLAVAIFTLAVAFFQLRAANNALDANNAFLVESRLFDLGIDALDTVQRAGRGDAQEVDVNAAFLRYEAALISAKALSEKNGLSGFSWRRILDAQCVIFQDNFDYAPELGNACSERAFTKPRREMRG